MSAFINDLASSVAVFATVPPGTHVAALNGETVDLIDSDGECFAIQQIGVFEEGHTWTGRIEQSADGTSGRTAISGAAFAAVTEGQNTQVIRFTRTARYVRYAASVVGADPEVNLAVLVGQVRKTF